MTPISPDVLEDRGREAGCDGRAPSRGEPV